VSSSFRATMAAVFAMLDRCAPGHTRRIGNHRLVVGFGGRVFMGLPKGPGGGHSVDAVVVEYAKIRRLVRALAIDPACARGFFEGL
jgi:hypothetical protein